MALLYIAVGGGGDSEGSSLVHAEAKPNTGSFVNGSPPARLKGHAIKTNTSRLKRVHVEEINKCTDGELELGRQNVFGGARPRLLASVNRRR